MYGWVLLHCQNYAFVLTKKYTQIYCSPSHSFFLTLAYKPARSYKSIHHFEFPLVKAFGGEEVRMQRILCVWKFLASASWRCNSSKEASFNDKLCSCLWNENYAKSRLLRLETGTCRFTNGQFASDLGQLVGKLSVINIILRIDWTCVSRQLWE